MTTATETNTHRLLLYITDYQAQYIYAPTIEEMAHALNVTVTTARRYRNQLVEAGLLTVQGKGHRRHYEFPAPIQQASKEQ